MRLEDHMTAPRCFVHIIRWTLCGNSRKYRSHRNNLERAKSPSEKQPSEIKNPSTVSDGAGGDSDERLMLGLRLSSGVDLADIYGEIPQNIKEILFRKSITQI